MAAITPDHDSPPPPVQMVQMLAGFQISQALYVIAKLDVAGQLVEGPRGVVELAVQAGVDEAALRRLLRSLASLGLFSEIEPDTYALTPLGATLAAGTPGSMRDLALTWMETHYAAFGRLIDGVREGEAAATLHYGMPFFAWLGDQPEQVERFTGAMGNLTDGIKAHGLAGYRLPAGEVVADLGGADGSVLAMLLEDRRGIVFDLPHVIAAAGERIAGLGLTAQAGDFFERVPAADVYLLSMVLHDWDDEQAARLLRSIASAARPGARVVALELVIPPGDAPHMAKMIDLTMLAMLTGRERTAAEHASLFASAGFTLDRVIATHSPMSIIEATLR